MENTFNYSIVLNLNTTPKQRGDLTSTFESHFHERGFKIVESKISSGSTIDLLR